MKRKIAILLSAMMVTSAMPMTASAAQLKSDSVQNTTSAKANETIDPNASKYTTYTTANDLQGRKSVLKIKLNDDNTDSVKAGTSFNVKLTNGTFGNYDAGKNLDNTEFGYRNVGVTLESLGFGAVESSRQIQTLTQVYDVISNPERTTVYDASNITAESSELAKAVFDKLSSASSGDKPSDNTQSALKTWLGDAYTKLLEDYKTQTEGTMPELTHIPYSIDLISPTEARITTKVDLTNSDKKINMSVPTTIDTSKLEIKLYKNDDQEATLNQENDLKEVKRIEITKLDEATTTKTKDLENPFIALPLGGVIADGDDPVKATVVADYTDKVVGGEYTITKGSENGSTQLVYGINNVKTFDEDSITIDSLTLKESVRDTIGKEGKKTEAKVTLRLSSGYRFKNPEKIKITDASGKNEPKGTFKFSGSSKGTIEATITSLNHRENPIGLDFGGIEIECDNDKNYGDVEITVSGDNINNQTVKVAKREKAGFKLQTVKDAKEIISGRHYEADKSTMSEQDNTTVEVKFSEAVANTLIEQKALDFTVPEGVKIVDADISNYKGFSTNPTDSSFEIRDNGRTLRLKRNEYKLDQNDNRLAGFKMKLNLSVDPGFKGDINLAVSGGGLNQITETVIAKAVLPFEMKTQTTRANIGYQDYNTADIVITEARPGMFLEGKDVVLSLTAPYGTQELGFSQAQFEVSGGELEVKEKDFKVGDKKYSDVNGESILDSRGTINFKINKASYKNPSTITIKNVKVGTTRSVPFGSYDLKLAGSAVINNFANKVDDEGTFTINATEKDRKALVLQDNISSYDFKNYLEVITEPGTLDQTVKVTVGEKTVLVGDKAIDMDVAPYIQASSNSTMVPLRFVSVALGVDSMNINNPDASSKIAWDANTKTTTIYYGAGTSQKIIQFQAGSNIMTVDGTRIPMEFGVKAEIKDGRMFVPFRALGQGLGVAVSWNADTRTAIYNENNTRNVNTTTTESTTATTTSKESTTESTTETTTSSN